MDKSSSSEDEIVDAIKQYEESQRLGEAPLITPDQFSSRIGNMGGSSSGEARVVEVNPELMRKRDARVLRSEHDRSMEALETGVPQEAPQPNDPPEFEEESPNEELPAGTAECKPPAESLLNAPVPDTAVLPELKFAKRAYGAFAIESFDPTPAPGTFQSDKPNVVQGSPFVKPSAEAAAQLHLRLKTAEAPLETVVPDSSVTGVGNMSVDEGTTAMEAEDPLVTNPDVNHRRLRSYA